MTNRTMLIDLMEISTEDFKPDMVWLKKNVNMPLYYSSVQSSQVVRETLPKELFH